MKLEVARDKFKIGDRVVATKAAHDNGVFMNARGPRELGTVFGTVVGFVPDQWCVRILRDGLKTKETYAAHFWQPHQQGHSQE